jgi:hypothetical protein
LLVLQRLQLASQEPAIWVNLKMQHNRRHISSRRHKHHSRHRRQDRPHIHFQALFPPDQLQDIRQGHMDKLIAVARIRTQAHQLQVRQVSNLMVRTCPFMLLVLQLPVSPHTD